MISLLKYGLYIHKCKLWLRFYAMLSDNPRTRIVWMFVNSDVLESADGTLIVSQEFFQLLEF